MRNGIYEVTVCDKNGDEFYEAEIDGTYCVRARTGKEYKVSMKIHPDAMGTFPYQHMICGITIDGIPAEGRYCELKPSYVAYSFSLKGFRINSDTLKAFKFASVNAATVGGAANAATANVGLIKVSFYEGIKMEQQPTHPAPLRTVNPATSTSADSKKFWQQPSLATTPGREIVALFTPSQYRRGCIIPGASVELRYHSATMFDLLEEMHNQRNAPPAPIAPPVHVDLSEEPDLAPAIPPTPPVLVDLRQDQDTVEEAAGGTRQAVKVEKKRKLKQENDERDTVIIVDLTN